MNPPFQITLPSAITFTPPPKNGVTYPPRTVTSITLLTWDDDGANRAQARFYEFPRPIPLWNSTTTPTYAAAGDWTTPQAVAAVLAYLGSDPASVIETLF